MTRKPPPQAVQPSRVPTLRAERRLLRAGHALVAGMDEVGRGALAGPVTVGVVVVDATVGTAPSGVRDSKLLSPAARVALAPRLRRWAVAHAVAHAEPDEIDRVGIIAALRLAGRRALAALPELPGCVLLDGSHDWLSSPSPRRGEAGGAARWPDAESPDAGSPDTEPLFDLEPDTVVHLGTGAAAGRAAGDPLPPSWEPRVHTQVKADLRCAAVAAASVLAKVERDSIMVRRAEDYPEYAWDANKGYAAPEHVAALAQRGPCPQHRRSWSLPGVVRQGGAVLELSLLDDVFDDVFDVVFDDDPA